MFHNNADADASHRWGDCDGEPESSIKHRIYLTPIYFIVYLAVGGDPFGAEGEGSHFSPFNSKIIKSTRDAINCVVSVASILACCGAVWILCGPLGFFAWYIIPVLLSHAWLFVVTFLQHHRPGTRVYKNKAWTYALGAMETIDRPMGPVLDRVTHYISSDHFVHHLTPSTIPWYNLPLATSLVAPLISRNIIPAKNPFVEYARIIPNTQLVKYPTGASIGVVV